MQPQVTLHFPTALLTNKTASTRIAHILLFNNMCYHVNPASLAVNTSCAAVDYGYEVEYTRVPVTDEKAPKEKDFALLMRKLWKPPEGAALIFNCQMGRGRTSTGMIIASLLQLRRRLKTVDLPTEPQGDVPTAQEKKREGKRNDFLNLPRSQVLYWDAQDSTAQHLAYIP